MLCYAEFYSSNGGIDMATLRDKNIKEHINALAKDFLCAMISDGYYWEVHSSEFRSACNKAFEMAEEFAKHEL